MGHALERRTAPRASGAENGMETLALQRYFGWESIDTAWHSVHLSGRHVLDAARAVRPALPAGHVEDRV